MRSFLLCVLCLIAWPATAKDLVVTVIGAPDDSRLVAIDRAIAFWNQALADAGNTDRLKRGATVANVLPINYFTDPRQGRLPDSPPPGTESITGDILIALPKANFISFSIVMPDGRKFIGLRSTEKHPLLDYPGIIENIAAHELGHALGMRHNDQPDKLMCGAPTPCRPDRFKERKGAFYPLTDEDRATLAGPRKKTL